MIFTGLRYHGTASMAHALDHGNHDVAQRVQPVLMRVTPHALPTLKVLDEMGAARMHRHPRRLAGLQGMDSGHALPV
uniref:Uncharacterized protein n=1 Tax=uncultured marine virus TaxID=186617 RepID=A0A0F7L6G3_9VIRU|nr:hypothetical protein [uncultured marine virus]